MNAITDRPWLLTGKRGVPGASLDMSFMTPGTLDPRITFTRASTGTYFDSAGVMQNAAVNLWLQSGDASIWNVGAVTVANPTRTANASVAPNGTMTAARVDYPAVSGAGSASLLFQTITVTAAVYTFSVYMRGNVGGEQIYIGANVSSSGYVSSPRITLTTSWQRYTFTSGALTAAGWTFVIGTDLRDGTQAGTAVQSVFVWGAQVELGSTATFYVPTTSAANGAPRWDYDPGTKQLNGLLLEEARTNSIKNSTMVGAVSGSPGTDPTGWTAATIGGLTKTIVGIGTESGIAYIDYRFQAAAATGGNLNFLMSPATTSALAASGSTVYTYSQYMAIVGGSTVGLPSFTFNMNQWDASSVSLGTVSSTAFGWVPFIVGDPLTKSRISYTFAATAASAAWVQPFFRISIAAGAVDFTIRIGAPQLELGSYVTSVIPTTTIAVTRARDVLSVAVDTWYDQTKGSLAFEYMPKGYIITNFSSPAQLVGSNVNTDFIDCTSYTTTGSTPGNATVGSFTSKVAGVLQGSAPFPVASGAVAPINVVHRPAVAWALANGMRAAHDGINATPVAGPAPAALPTIISLTLAGIANSQPQVSLWARKFRYWNRQLSQDELNRISRGL